MTGFGASGALAFYGGVVLGFPPEIALGATLLMLLARIALTVLVCAEDDAA